MSRLRVVLSICVVSVAGCGGEADTPPTGEAALPKAELKLDKLPKKTTEAKIQISGVASPGARVTAQGKNAIAKDKGKFVISLPLKVGRNKLLVTARRDDLQGGRAELEILRTQPSSDRDAPELIPGGTGGCPPGHVPFPVAPRCTPEPPPGASPEYDDCVAQGGQPSPGGCLGVGSDPR